MNGFELRRFLLAEAVSMANRFMDRLPPGLAVLEPLPQPGQDYKFNNPVNQQLFQAHCHAVETYYAFLEAAVSMTTGMWAVPPGDPVAAGQPATPSSPGTASFGAALTAFLNALPQSGSVTQAQAVSTVTQAIATNAALGSVGSAILAAIPATVGQWPDVVNAIKNAFAGGSAPIVPKPSS